MQNENVRSPCSKIIKDSKTVTAVLETQEQDRALLSMGPCVIAQATAREVGPNLNGQLGHQRESSEVQNQREGSLSGNSSLFPQHFLRQHGKVDRRQVLKSDKPGSSPQSLLG